MTTLYLLENEGFHSGKDEGNITKAAQRHGSNPAWLSTVTSDHHMLLCPSVGTLFGLLSTAENSALTLHTAARFTLEQGNTELLKKRLFTLSSLPFTSFNIQPATPTLFDFYLSES